MIFYRQGEITDERERQNLQMQSQEVGDEYQKGLALCLLSILFIVTGAVLFVCYAIYTSLQNEVVAESLRLGGTFTLGIGTVFGLPGLAYIFLFYKDQKSRPSTFKSNTVRLTSIAQELSDTDTVRLLKSAHRLAMKLEFASLESMHSQTRSMQTMAKAVFDHEVDKKPRSFSDFGRTDTISNFELYRQRLLKDYLDVILSSTKISDDNADNTQQETQSIDTEMLDEGTTPKVVDFMSIDNSELINSSEFIAVDKDVVADDNFLDAPPADETSMDVHSRTNDNSVDVEPTAKDNSMDAKQVADNDFTDAEQTVESNDSSMNIKKESENNSENALSAADGNILVENLNEQLPAQESAYELASSSSTQL